MYKIDIFMNICLPETTLILHILNVVIQIRESYVVGYIIYFVNIIKLLISHVEVNYIFVLK